MKKLLVWDGDNTLWNGTLAEGDVPTLSPGRWELCEELNDRGVLQALATHNREEDARVALRALGLEPFFLYNQAVFGPPKSAMIRAIVQDYALSKYSDVVFIDDNLFNREEVRQALPLVEVFDPQDLGNVVQGFFTKEHYTDEDRLRVRRYQSEEQRKRAAVAYGEDYVQFLRSCGIVLEVKRATVEDLPRVVDLIHRANRMAALARLFTEEELREAVDRPTGGNVWVARVRDKFGDYGLSAVMITDVKADNGVVRIVALVISCRLQGRGIGSAFIGWLLNRYATRTHFIAAWQETDYNAGMRALYEWYHFAFDEYEWYHFAFGEDDSRRVEARLVRQEPVALPDWVQVKALE